MDGEHDMVSILLGVNTQLLEFDFQETFVDSFAVYSMPYQGGSLNTLIFCKNGPERAAALDSMPLIVFRHSKLLLLLDEIKA